MKVNIYSKEPKKTKKIFCSTYMYDGIVTDGEYHNFDVPKDRLEMIVNVTTHNC